MRSLIELLGCGNLFRQDQDACEYRVTNGGYEITALRFY
jgi:hypothetical protein